ncbi:dienelactone hydrolase family protein [Sphingomonas sp. So64.6b]|uniref:dienelactone hydrolase family protein n=1 Tax=Sphingomonas sp. So64.6b TaxID=2997354 RepID=UPI001602BDE4|nr:dienelactone hydrolase family protein [Sphingomonas sp. So64.6b]QNA84970.1 dienelactone hydrolase family protein [Sphingomonas sp. So64.6b]
MSDIRDRAVQIYDAFTHEHRNRRTLLRQMAVLAGSVAAAETLIAGIAASPAAAAMIDPTDPRLVTRKDVYNIGPGRNMTGYFAAPRDAKGAGSVVVVHENRGLTPHIEDVARRVALAGYFAVAPDFLSDQGGTPADENAARDLIGKANYDAVIANAIGTIARLKTREHGNGKAGIIGFCWGGALVDRVAITAGDALSAGVSYYGLAPAPEEAVKVQAPLLLHYAGKDTRVAATGVPWTEALKAAGKQVTAYTYEGVDHAFNNDTSKERYNEAAAKLAWDRTVAFFHSHLDG